MPNWTRFDTRALIEAADETPCMSIGMVKAIRRHHAEPGLVERMARLEEFIGQTDAVPHVWGVSDCSLMIADWALANGHADAAAHLRGQYGSEAECRALLVGAGGLSTVVVDCAARIGLAPLHEPEFGCVGVIGSQSNADRQWSAIWNGHRWLVRWVGPKDRPTWAPFAAKALNMWRV